MKRFTAILLIFLLLFNILGFYGIFVGLQYHHERLVKRQFDNASSISLQTFVVKVPIAVPYAFDQPAFERIDGEIEYEGEFYRLIRQRLAQDTLFIMYIKDAKKKRMDEIFEAYTKTVNDKSTAGGHSTGAPSVSTNDYLFDTFSIKNFSVGWVLAITPASKSLLFFCSYLGSIIHPPECMALS